MPDRPSSRGGTPRGGSAKGPRTPRPESADIPPPPLPEHALNLDFTFDLAGVPLPEPEPVAEGEEEPEPPKPPLEGTYFVLKLPSAFNEDGTVPEGTAYTDHELKHPQTGEDRCPESSSVELTITHQFIRWLVVESQGVLPLSLWKRGVDGAADAEVGALPLDAGSLLFGKLRATCRYEALGPPADYSFAPAASAPGMTPRGNEGAPLPLPEAVSELATSINILCDTDVPLLSPELVSGLNPMALTIVRADNMPPAYSGTPYKRPFEELGEKCAPVYVNWSLLGTDHTCGPRPHGQTIRWDERRLLLAGSRSIAPSNLCTQLREVGLHIELHDRDPGPELLAPAPSPAGAPEGAPAGGEEGAEGEAPAPTEAPAGAPSDAPAESAQHPPFGVAVKKLSELIPRRPTDSAGYAELGIPVRASRRFTLELEVFPCERPKQRPEPEEVAAEYYAGSYVESGTELTVNIELAQPLEPEKKPRPSAELQRIVTLIRYNDTPMLLGLLNVVKAANDAIGMNSASAWESYKEEKREDLDLITGMQLVDGETRLFMYEGHPASFKPLNAMGRLMTLLERKQPNSSTTFTLMNSSITFPNRLYNTFEMPTKLIKLRSTVPHLLLRPEIYQYLRVQEGCRDALLCLGKLLTSSTIRYAHKAQAWPMATNMLQLEKKFGGVQLVVDREGVVDDGEEEIDVTDIGAGTGAATGGKAGHGKSRRHREEPRKAPTDCQNKEWLASLKGRGDLPKIDWLARNIAELPVAPEPKPLPKWYLESIPKLGKDQPQVYMYSGQRLNQTEVQKEKLRNKLGEMLKEGKHMAYSRDFLWADSVGDREERMVKVDPDAHLTPWDKSEKEIYNKDGTRSAFRLHQPSGNRQAELETPWDEDEIRASRMPLKRAEEPPRYADGRLKPRFDPNPKPPGYMEKGLENYTSIFQQTEEQVIAEKRERKEGAIEIWTKKLVVDDPVLRVQLRSTDKVPQTERLHGILADPPDKRALKKLYRGKNRLTLTSQPSAFMGEATVDVSLLNRGPGLRATWTTSVWPDPDERKAGDATWMKDNTLKASSPRSTLKSTLGKKKATF